MLLARWEGPLIFKESSRAGFENWTETFFKCFFSRFKDISLLFIMGRKELFSDSSSSLPTNANLSFCFRPDLKSDFCRSMELLCKSWRYLWYDPSFLPASETSKVLAVNLIAHSSEMTYPFSSKSLMSLSLLMSYFSNSCWEILKIRFWRIVVRSYLGGTQ